MNIHILYLEQYFIKTIVDFILSFLNMNVELKFIIEDINLFGGLFKVKYFSHIEGDDTALTTSLDFPPQFRDRSIPTQEDLIAIAKLNFPFKYFIEREKQKEFSKQHQSDLNNFNGVLQKEITFNQKEIEKLSNRFFEPNKSIEYSRLKDKAEVDIIRKIVISLLEEMEITK